MKFRCAQQHFAKIIYMKFHKNPINGLVTDTRPQAGRHYLHTRHPFLLSK